MSAAGGSGRLPGREGVPRFTAPLGLMDYVTQPKVRLDIVPVLDLLAVGLLFGLLFSRFVMTPGVSVELPATGLQMAPGSATVHVLTIENEGSLFFDGSVYELSTIEAALRETIGHQQNADPVLLIKAQAGLGLESFLELCGMAQAAGFGQIQVAGRKITPEAALVPKTRADEGSESGLPGL